MTSEELDELVRQFQAQGGQITAAVPAPAKGKPSAADDPALVEAIRQRAADGVMAIAKALKRATRTINAVARRHDIQIAAGNPHSNSRIKIDRNRRLRAALAPKVQRLANRGLIQVEIAAQLGTTRAIVRRIAAEHGININSRAR